MSSENEAKLRNSIRRNGLLGAIVARELNDGSLEIIGGEHRVEIAIEEGIEKVAVHNLGFLPDDKAKELMLLDNGRYGQDDAFELAALLDELSVDVDLASFMPHSSEDMDKLLTTTNIDLDALDDELNSDLEDVAVTSEKRETPTQTHQVLRFKVGMDDVDRVQRVMNRIMAEQGFSESDSMTNAGDALVHLVGEYDDE
ncbi:chromosome partitioning protein ParB [Vreelandella sulfidaeris]|uniref:Chromosome partitioning protein ParB n=1 Tax=Vreelandella sulfidaeris TaxID=115553 RepID=A0A455U6F2_9GAMM|nr:chromosome partitioning protein ParB [Halomonas sulfidaeris]